MYNHSRCHRSEVSLKVPFGQVVLVSLLTALRLFPIDHLRLHIKGLKPQAKVWGDSKEGLARNDERRDVKKGVRSEIVEI